ncbi:MAG: metallophosphoesterase [Oscillospiraceae bacterium]|nr:metallophosphoesterase [Oscillospiraceae bacterium]
MKRILQATALMLAAVILLAIPSAQARFIDHFGFGLDTRNSATLPLNNARTTGTAANIAANAQRGFDIVHSANHLFEFRGSSHSAGEVQTLTNLLTGYYGFVIRGGDGGVGRMQNHFSAYGGSGGYVMGYFHVDATVTSTLYIQVGHAGRGWKTANDWGGWPGGGYGEWWSGSGGGYTMIATSSNVTSHNSSIVAVAGGGGGGGAVDSNGLPSGDFNDVRDNTDPNSRGGHAGGAGPLGDAFNPALNGSAAGQTGTVAINSGGVNGRISGGLAGGNPAQVNIRNKSRGHLRPPRTEGNGGGGGGTTQGGEGGWTQPGTSGTALQGGGGAPGHGGGGGGGFFGGGGGERLGDGAGNRWKGGGGGGSSFVRHDVQPLPAGIINSVYFNPFVTLPNNEYNMYTTSRVRPNRYRRSARPTGENYVGNTISGELRLNDGQIQSAFQNNGFNGFAFIKYLGPLPPGDDTIIRTGWPFDATPEQAPLPPLSFSVFADVHMNTGWSWTPLPSYGLSTNGRIRFNALLRALDGAGIMPNDALIILGDNTDGADREQHYLFYALNAGENKIAPQNHFVVLGNHDLDSVGFATGLDRHLNNNGSSIRYRGFTGLPINQMNPPVFENRQVNGYTFIVLGPEVANTGGQTYQPTSNHQLNLLRAALASSPPGKPIFIFSHMSHDRLRLHPGGANIAAEVESIIRQYPDVFFFHGHTHWAFSVNNHAGGNHPHAFTRVNAPYFGETDGLGRGVYVQVLPDRVVLRHRNFAGSPATWGNTHTVMLTNPRGM